MTQSGSEDLLSKEAALSPVPTPGASEGPGSLKDLNEQHVVQGLISELVSQVDHLLLFKSPVDDKLDFVTSEAVKKETNGDASECFEFHDDDDGSADTDAATGGNCTSGNSGRGDKRIGLLPGFKLQLKRKITAVATPDPNVQCSEHHQQQQHHHQQQQRQAITGNSVQSESRNEFKRTRTSAVGYVFSADLIRESCRLPKVKSRAHLVHELICAYKLPSTMLTIKSDPATHSELRSFHTEDYMEYVKSVSEKGVAAAAEDGILDTTLTGELFGLGYDCPSFPNMYQTMREIAGSSLSGVRALVQGDVSIAINWCGGWHHSKADEASGYCYVNDIVISILKLLDCGYTRILYVDFDLHHGDAVEHAFEHSSKVLTLSFHKYEVGFFPGTGDVNDAGSGKGKGYSVNMPFRDGVTDDKYMMVTREILQEVKRCYDPEFIVAQFGADGMTGDPMNSFNLTPKSLMHCVRQLKQFHVPLLILGGGGYHSVNTAKCWTQLTAAACHVDLENDIPDHSNFLQYGPHFELDIDPGLRKDFNSFDDLKHSVRIIQQRLSLLRK